ncbi:MAG TPA: prenyltransferase/squalene oxidase repeat-containing protein [Roseiflexaceae bacterium]|nr:prenyltransferase/squalene oxidase repeat-containing protein [Roseiflexaceae bacterium]
MSQRLSLRGPLLLAMAVSLLFVALLYALPVHAQPSVPTAAPNTADLVVQFGDGLVVTRRITFTGTISGLEALRRTGLALVEKNGGVCRIEDTGCAAGEDCFCGCPPPFAPCLFWNYQRWNGSAWVASAQGAAVTTVSNGAVEGWSWGRQLPPARPAVLGASAGLQWLAPLQNSDGSYGGAGGNAGATIDTLLANRALGGDAAAWKSAAGNSLIDPLRTQAAEYAARGASTAGKLALGLAAADLDPHTFAGLNLVISMTASFDPASGAYGATNWDQAFALLGMRAAGEAVPPTAANLLRSRANADGGWAFAAPGESDVDSTGLVLQALIAAGVPPTDTAIVNGLAYLDTAQNADGGFPNAPIANNGDTSNADSTAFAVQGILASREDPLAARWQPAASNPISYLLGLQQADGAFTFGGQPSQLATQQAIPALAGRPFPYLSRAVASRIALRYTLSQQGADGSFAGFGLGSTLDALLAIDAAGGDSQSTAKALEYLRPRAAAYAAGSAAATGKLTAAIVAVGADPRSFAGLNLVISNTLRYNPTSGAFGSSTFDQAWAMLGLAAAGQTIPLSATEHLQAIQATGGGWGFAANATAGDADSTGLALQALAAAGVRPALAPATQISAAICTSGAGSSNPAVLDALAFLRTHENSDGGFHPDFDTATSPSSTGLALQGLAAYHELPRGLSWTNVITGGASALTLHNPVDALLGMQTLDGGFPGFGGPNDPAATYQALPGLLGRAFPASIRTLRYLPLARH